MEAVSIVLFLLLAVVLSGSISRMLPVPVPTPLVQIMLGAVIGMSTSYRVALDPELFLLLFLPPLLFLDGWRIPKDELLKDISTVVELALGLVLITVIGMGLFIHWMIPAMPLAVAFALAAVVSPTDPIAVSAIAARVPIPKRMMHILEGESLLNDASGLVCLRFAIAAALTGSFSPSSAAINFVWVAGAGIVVGVGLTLAVTRAKAWVSRRFGEESGSQILVSLLIPFGSYLLAEHLHASGILAAVAAGVTMTYAEISRQALPNTRMRRNSVWDTIQFALNGIIFVLLGEQLPAILAGARTTVKMTGHDSTGWLAAYVLAIVAGLAALRFVWVWVSLRLTLLRRRYRDGVTVHSPDWRVVAAMSLAGVRGAITLAGVLTIPLVLDDGTAFPARDLAIFLAAGVIIVSLVLASVGLPILLNGLTMPPEPSLLAEEDAARVAAAEAAIRAVERSQHELAERMGDGDFYAAAGGRVMDIYRDRIDSRSGSAKASAAARVQDRIERDFKLVALQAERSTIVDLARDRRIGSATIRKLVRELDLVEARYRS
ncbi:MULTISPECIES: Na+/H+ antiporter [unclassified Sphingomonas]|uniref:Na+/H+ antiporter n=1 Tax=unclassified Sphingomonas TaxID=196159 RepID=UPI000B088752|nr:MULTISPECIES: Na+/H+ antiporter [unclassified Sphingomonas]MBD8470859.1 Na+/H+ antiporter [Sphingomonas sp. CFBP 8765]MDY1006627.1 Na+/H+ antiporter [Sphingomonas sp. CFBP9019]